VLYSAGKLCIHLGSIRGRVHSEVVANGCQGAAFPGLMYLLVVWEFVTASLVV